METHSNIFAWRTPWTEKVKGMTQVWENIVVKERMGFPGGSDGKESVCSAGDLGSIPGLGRSPEGRNSNPLQYLAWKIPRNKEPGRLQSMGLQRVRDD